MARRLAQGMLGKFGTGEMSGHDAAREVRRQNSSVHRCRGPAAASRQRDRHRHRPRARSWPIHHGARSADAGKRSRSLLRRAGGDRLLQRHRCARPRADGERPEGRRRDHLSLLHLCRHRRGRRLVRRDADLHRRAAGHFQRRSGRYRSGGREGQAAWDCGRSA